MTNVSRVFKIKSFLKLEKVSRLPKIVQNILFNCQAEIAILDKRIFSIIAKYQEFLSRLLFVKEDEYGVNFVF